MLIGLINSKWNFVSELNNHLISLKDKNNEEVSNTIADIRNDEVKHIGELQNILKLYSPNVANI